MLEDGNAIVRDVRWSPAVKTEGEAADVTPMPAEKVARARGYAGRAKASETIRAYRSDWEAFCVWCREMDAAALPALGETVAVYLAELADAGLSVSSIERRRAAIAHAHKLAGAESPTKMALVEETLAGIRREKGTRARGKTPVLTADLRAMVGKLPNTIRGVRDRAVLLIGFAGAFRRSELVSLEVADVTPCPEGLRILLRRSKTDQEGRGLEIGIPRGEHLETCPARAWEGWLAMSGITEGPAFRGLDRFGHVLGRLSGRGIARVVKAAAGLAGLNPAHYSGHSLRAGLATAAAGVGAGELAIMRQTRHRSVETLKRYIRPGSLFRDNVAGKVGL